MKEVRVRYAPSPTGYLHIGNARTALFNYLYAKNKNGKLIVRIEDTDLARNLEDGVSSQLDNLKWLGINWDESVDIEGEFGPYNQLKRHEDGIYQPFIQKLLDEGKAYRCFCTSEELDAEAEKQKAAGKIPQYNGKCRNLKKEEVEAKIEAGLSYTVRFKVEDNIEIKWNDLVKGEVTFNSNDVSGDFNILKRDGIPTYNFAVVIDDSLMKITDVLRGEDHISNTPKQIMIYNALNLEIPTFAHMTLIVNEAGKKLSKRDGGIIQFIEQYKDLGYLPEAMFNFITLLGWSPKGEEEIFSKEDLIKIFDANRLSKSPAKFDVNKLQWINNQYVKKMEDDKYLELVIPFLKEGYKEIISIKQITDDKLNKIALLYKNQISYGQEIVEVSDLFFKEYKLNEEAKEFINNEPEENIKNIVTTLKTLENEELTVENIKAKIKSIQKEYNIKGKSLFMPIRIILTGQMHGPELAETIVILGEEQIFNNLQTFEKEIN